MPAVKKLRSRVLLADDHKLIIEGVKQSLEESGEFEMIGEATTGSQVMPLVRRLQPDLVMLDIRMPGMDGLTCLEQIKKRHPEIKVIVLSVSTDQKLIENVLKRGASAYIVKSVNPVDLPSAIRQAIDETVYTAIGLPDASLRKRREGGGPDRPRARDPVGARARALERRDRQGALGRPADGQVPPDEHLPQARRREPHRGCAVRVPAGPRREPHVRRRRRGLLGRAPRPTAATR